jgi:hypothetical protein
MVKYRVFSTEEYHSTQALTQATVLRACIRTVRQQVV